MNTKKNNRDFHLSLLINRFFRRYFRRWMSDETWIKLYFRYNMGYKLDLKKPKTYSEKLQWLKLYDQKSEYSKMVDKSTVKEYVAKILSDDFIIPTLGVWDRPEDIEWDQLPDQFVLKCTHDSGSVCICKDKTIFNRENAINKLRSGLNVDYYRTNLEWPYKNVKPRVMAEKYIAPESGTNDLPDYKFFCFNGIPHYCQVISGRQVDMRVDFFDKDWNHQPFHEPRDTQFADVMPEKPRKFDVMWDAAMKLSHDIPFSRIDFYEVGDKVLFGEITFFPTGGRGGFSPEIYDEILGKLIHLPSKKIIG